MTPDASGTAGGAASGALDIRLKRIFEPVSLEDGRRILVDRLWPRGVTETRAALDAWMREIAPTDGLRRWFGHDPERWEGFIDRYAQELDNNPRAVEALERLAREGRVTLLYSAKDERHNQAVALEAYLAKRAE